MKESTPQFKKGINQLSFPDSIGLIDCMKLAKHAGFDGIEPVMHMTGEFSLTTSDIQIEDFGKASREIGIEISSVCQHQHRYYSISSNRQDIREHAKDSLKRLIDIACFWNVRNVLVVPGAVCLPPVDAKEVEDFKTNFFAGSEIVDYDVVYERSVETFRELSGYAKERNVCMCVENISNCFLLSPLEMRSFIDEIGSDNVQVYLDVGNITAINGFAEQWIKILAHRIKVLHIKDFRRLVATRHGYVDLLSGDVDFVKVMEALRGIGYCGWLNAEVFPKYRNYSDQVIFNTLASMERIINMQA